MERASGADPLQAHASHRSLRAPTAASSRQREHRAHPLTQAIDGHAAAAAAASQRSRRRRREERSAWCYLRCACICMACTRERSPGSSIDAASCEARLCSVAASATACAHTATPESQPANPGEGAGGR